MSFKHIERPKSKANKISLAEEIKRKRDFEKKMKSSLTWLLAIVCALGYGVLYLINYLNTWWSYAILGFFLIMVFVIQWFYPNMDD